MRPKKLPLSASCCVWLVCTSVLGRGLKRYCNTLTVFEEHLQFWQVGMTWDASMIGCYSFSVNDASCSDCLSFFGQSWSSMTPLRSLSWRRVNRLSNHLKCLFFIWFYLEIVYGILYREQYGNSPQQCREGSPTAFETFTRRTKFWLGKLPGSIGACASLFAYSLVDLRIFHNSTRYFRSLSYKNHPHPGMAVSALDRHVDLFAIGITAWKNGNCSRHELEVC